MSENRKEKEIRDRREKVKKLYYVQRVKISTIANQLGVNYRTIERDTDAIRKECIKEIKKDTANKLIIKVVSSNEEIILSAWLMYSANGAKPNTKLKALSLIQKTEESNIKIFQELGLLDKVADPIDLGMPVEVLDFIKRTWKVKKG